MITVRLADALAITTRLRVCENGIEPALSIAEHMIERKINCDEELIEAVEVCRERFIEVNPWMELAMIPQHIAECFGGAFAWLDTQQRKHGEHIDVPWLAPERRPAPHGRCGAEQFAEAMVMTPDGPVPLSSLPNEVQNFLRYLGFSG